MYYHQIFLFCFSVLNNKMMPSSTYDIITRCIANDSCETNNAFNAYLVDMLALTISKCAMFNTSICSCDVNGRDITISAIDSLKVSVK